MKMHLKRTLCLLLTIALTVFLTTALKIPASAASDISVTVSSPTGTYIQGNTMYIDSEITVSSTENLTGGTVNINGFISGDILSFTNANGVTGSYSGSKGILTISGNATAAAYQEFLRSITFSSTSTSGSRTFEIILSNTGSSTLYCSDTGHFYQYVGINALERTNWATARSNAANMEYTYNGTIYNGYLATITTAEENAFITDKLGSDAWIGASDAGSENTWLWVTGPENGTEFFYGNGSSGITHIYTYANWNSGEPNDAGGEDYAEIYCSSSVPGKWNDLNGTQSLGYVVEYGDSHISLGSSGSATKTITITSITPPGAPTIGTAMVGDSQATVSFTAPASDGGATITEYTVTSNPGGITATGSSSPINVTGLTNGTAYTFTVTATNSAGTGSASAASVVIIPAPSDDASLSQPSDGAPVIVNGETQSAGTSQTTTENGQTTTTVTVDEQKLQQILDEKGDYATVVIPINTGSDVTAGVLTGQMVKNMETTKATLIVQTVSATYNLPVSEINIDEVSKQLGQDVKLSDIKVEVRIAEPPAATVKVVENAAQIGEFSIVVPAVDFTICCTNGSQTVEVSSFCAYVERTIAIPDGVDPFKITTGIVVEPDGTTHHVPTKVTVINGKYYAVINSLTNSTYVVVWHPIEFADVVNHWAKDAINDMGSRMVVNGVDGENYAPNRDITRAEFVAIVVRALGLEPEIGENQFSDITAADWYCGYIKTAFSYGIITGYNAKTFGPNDKITREQVMAMIARAMKITGLNASMTGSEISTLLGSYSDAGNASDYAKESIAVCLKTGIIMGRGNSAIAPQNYITRAEVAVIIERLLQKSNLI